MDLAVSTIADAKATAIAYSYANANRFLNTIELRILRYQKFLSTETLNYLSSKVYRLSGALGRCIVVDNRTMVKLKLISKLIKLLRKQLVVVSSRLMYNIKRHAGYRPWKKLGLSDIILRHNLPR